jgi:hypothetical protein
MARRTTVVRRFRAAKSSFVGHAVFYVCPPDVSRLALAETCTLVTPTLTAS